MKKTWIPDKAAWAAAEAAKVRDEIAALPYVMASDWRGRRQREDTLKRLYARASKLDAIADSYRTRQAS